MSTKSSIVPINEYQALAVNDLGLSPADIIAANYGEDGITERNLARIPVPAGGGMAWTIPTATGEPDIAKSVSGIVLHNRKIRQYWVEEYDGERNPPDCCSDDGITGNGSPGGRCRVCPMNNFPEDGGSRNSKPCKERVLLFILRPDAALPDMVSIPPGSLKVWWAYIDGLTRIGRPLWSVVTELRLQKAQSKGGIDFAQVTPVMAAQLTKEEIAALAGYREALMDTFTAVSANNLDQVDVAE
jgi:hypothetical protein